MLILDILLISFSSLVLFGFKVAFFFVVCSHSQTVPGLGGVGVFVGVAVSGNCGRIRQTCETKRAGSYN
jgi:hypothetical protein